LWCFDPLRFNETGLLLGFIEAMAGQSFSGSGHAALFPGCGAKSSGEWRRLFRVCCAIGGAVSARTHD
jgi:hypothetical protein